MLKNVVLYIDSEVVSREFVSLFVQHRRFTADQLDLIRWRQSHKITNEQILAEIGLHETMIKSSIVVKNLSIKRFSIVKRLWEKP